MNHHFRRVVMAFALSPAALTAVAAHRARAQATPSATARPQPGSFEVGFRAFVQYDYSRTYHRDYDGRGDPVTGERARPIQTSIWYPAVHRSGAHPMTYADYLAITALEEGPVRMDSTRRHRTLAKAAADWEWKPSEFDRLISRAATAYADATPAAGRFPVVIYGPSFDASSWENAELCELLASHGYVVIASPALGVYGRGQTTTLESVDAEARDMEFLIGYSHTLADADAAHLGVMGFSWGGLADVIVALRNPGVRAVVGLDGSIRYWERLIKDTPYGSAHRLTAPFLFLGQATIPPDTARKRRMTVSGRAFPFYDSVSYADAYYLTLEKMQHGNFGGTGNLLTNAEGRASWSDTAAVRQSFNLAQHYVLHFFDAYLKADAAGKGFLARTPEANGAPSGWVVASAKTAHSPPRDVNAFAHYVRDHGGWAQASEAVAALRREDPGYAVPPEDLATMGQAALDDKRYADAVAISKVNVLLHPTSAEALDGLGEAYATAHDTALAVATFRQSIAVDSTRPVATAWLDRLGHP